MRTKQGDKKKSGKTARIRPIQNVWDQRSQIIPLSIKPKNRERCQQVQTCLRKSTMIHTQTRTLLKNIIHNILHV